jgi:hypothetical protein
MAGAMWCCWLRTVQRRNWRLCASSLSSCDWLQLWWNGQLKVDSGLTTAMSSNTGFYFVFPEANNPPLSSSCQWTSETQYTNQQSFFPALPALWPAPSQNYLQENGYFLTRVTFLLMTHKTTENVSASQPSRGRRQERSNSHSKQRKSKPKCQNDPTAVQLWREGVIHTDGRKWAYKEHQLNARWIQTIE